MISKYEFRFKNRKFNNIFLKNCETLENPLYFRKFEFNVDLLTIRHNNYDYLHVDLQ